MPSQIAVLRFLRAKGVPAFIITCEYYGALEPNLEQEIHKFPVDQAHHLIKPYDSAFTCCEFDPLLQRRNIKKLFLMGINAGFCVYNTAADALRLGYKVATAPDVIAGFVGRENFRTTCADISWYKQHTMCLASHASLIG